MRINFKKGLIGLILFSFTITAIAALIISINYNTSYTYTLRVFKRKIQLELISLGLRLYDPIESIRSNTGEELFNKTTASLYQREKKKLLAILKRMIDTKKEGSVSIDLYDNQHITRSRYEFGYAPFNERRRLQFGKIFHAESSLVSDNDFSVILNLRNYVKSLWQHGQDKGFNPDRFDAIEITKNAKMGRKYWCHVYSLTFIQIASSVGITSRLVTLSDDGYEKDHAVVEVWSNYYKKWIIMDVDYNIHYTRIGDKMPLNAVELHNAFMEDKIDEISVIKGKPRPVGYEVERVNDKLLSFYKYIYIDLRNDWYTNDYIRGHPKRSDYATLFWEDSRLSKILNLYKKTHDLDVFYWALNQTEIYFANEGDNILQLYLKTLTPNFKSFIVTIDDKTTNYYNKPVHNWKLHDGENTFTVMSLNKNGVQGVKSKIIININNNSK